jgi:hypothetical protein
MNTKISAITLDLAVADEIDELINDLGTAAAMHGRAEADARREKTEANGQQHQAQDNHDSLGDEPPPPHGESDYGFDTAGSGATGGKTRDDNRPFPKPHLITAADLDEHTLPPRKWLLGRTLLRGEVSGTIGGGGIGKSSLTLGMAMSLITGRNLIGEMPHEQGPCWVHNGEDDIVEQRRRLTALRIHYDIPAEHIAGKLFLTSGVEAGLIVACQTPRGVIHTPHVAHSIEFIRDNRILAAVFDPFADLQEGVFENDNASIKAVMRAVKQIAFRTNAAIDIAHHVGKPPRGHAFQPGDPNMARGAISFIDSLRIAQQLTNMTKEDAEALKVPDEEVGLYLRRDDGKLNFSLKTGEALAWYKRITVILANGDHVGVIAPHAFQKGKDTVDGIADRTDERTLLGVIDDRWNSEADPFMKRGEPSLRHFMTGDPYRWKAGRTDKCVGRLTTSGSIKTARRKGKKTEGWCLTDKGKTQLTSAR